MKKCLRIFKVIETREKIKNCQRGRKIICENLKPIRAEGEEQQDLLFDPSVAPRRIRTDTGHQSVQQSCKTEGEIYGVKG